MSEHWPDVYDQVFTRLDGLRQTKHGWEARCPAHDDRHPSLSLRVAADDGRLLVRCHRQGGEGCSAAEIVAALDLSLADLFADRPTAKGWPGQTPRGVPEDVYCYRDERGLLLFEVLRYRLPDGRKEFRQRRPNLQGHGWVWNLDGVRRVLYRLPEVLRALAEDPLQRVAVVEGEKAANALWRIGVPATCNPGGAGKWSLCDRPSILQVFAARGGARAVVCPDNDPYDPRTRSWTGQQHAEDVCRDLFGVAREVKYVDLPGVPLKGDAHDWVASLADRHLSEKADRFWALAKAAPPWFPPDQPHPFQARMEQLAGDLAVTSQREWARKVESLAGELYLATFAASPVGVDKVSLAERLAVELAAQLLAGCETFWDLSRRRRSLPPAVAGLPPQAGVADLSAGGRRSLGGQRPLGPDALQAQADDEPGGAEGGRL